MKFLSTILSTIAATILLQGVLSSSALRGNVDETEKAFPIKDYESIKATIKQYRGLLMNRSFSSHVKAPKNDRSLQKADKCPSFLWDFYTFFDNILSPTEGILFSYELGKPVAIFLGTTTGYEVSAVSGELIYIPDSVNIGGSPSAPLEAPAAAANNETIIVSHLNGIEAYGANELTETATPLIISQTYSIPYGKNLCGANKLSYVELLYLDNQDSTSADGGFEFFYNVTFY